MMQIVKKSVYVCVRACVRMRVCVRAGWGIPQVSKVPYLDSWQWNPSLCILHQGKPDTDG